jgi:hypothetical protein
MLACKSKFGAIAHLLYLWWGCPFVTTTLVFMVQLAGKAHQQRPAAAGRSQVRVSLVMVMFDKEILCFED